MYSGDLLQKLYLFLLFSWCGQKLLKLDAAWHGVQIQISTESRGLKLFSTSAHTRHVALWRTLWLRTSSTKPQIEKAS